MGDRLRREGTSGRRARPRGVDRARALLVSRLGLLFGAFLGLVALGAVVERPRERAVVARVDHDAAHLGDLFPAGIALHPISVQKVDAGSKKSDKISPWITAV